VIVFVRIRIAYPKASSACLSAVHSIPKAHDVDTAINSFTRSVQLDPDNGESWNNLAALNTLRKRSKEAFREALKYKRNSWQMWENFAQVSADVNNFAHVKVS